MNPLPYTQLYEDHFFYDEAPLGSKTRWGYDRLGSILSLCIAFEALTKIGTRKEKDKSSWKEHEDLC